MTPENLERARSIVEAVVHEVMDDVVFDEILVTPDPYRQDEDAPDYLKVRAIYEGEREQLRRRTLKLRRIIRDRLLDEGIVDFPVLYLIKKSEWDECPDPS